MLHLIQTVQEREYKISLLTACKEEQLMDTNSSFSDFRTSVTKFDVSNL